MIALNQHPIYHSPLVKVHALMDGKRTVHVLNAQYVIYRNGDVVK